MKRLCLRASAGSAERMHVRGKRLLVCLASIFCCSCLYSQEPPPLDFDIKNMLPTSPEAASLGRFGDIPIGYYTGTAEVSIPLFSIREAGVEIPMVLRYHNSGVKVEDQGSWVGLGWNLEPGGAIIQVINGTQDGLDRIEPGTVGGDPTGYAYLEQHQLIGEYSMRHESGLAVPPCPIFITGAPPGDSYYTMNRLLAGDDQPDIYQYSFSGYSGKFFINPDSNKVVLIDENAPINFVQNNPGSWTATTPDGNQFIFSAEETSTTYLTSQNTGFTWKLTSVQLSNGKVINFNYSNGHYEWFTYYETYHSYYAFNLNPTGEFGLEPHSDVSQHNTKNLTQITTPDMIINFNLEPRQDLDFLRQDSSMRLGSIDFVSAATGEKVRSFHFFYDYFPYTTTGGSFVTFNNGTTQAELDVMGKRLRLDSVQETGYTRQGVATSKAPYRFLYNSTLLPLKTSFARDFWGYYNGAANQHLLPDLSYFYYSGNMTRDTIYHHLPAELLQNTYFTGSNRYPDTSYMKAGVLTRITYPTGGYSEFDYEANAFTNNVLPDAASIAASTKQYMIQDRNYFMDVSFVHLFLPHRTTIVRFSNLISRGNPNQGLSFASIQPSEITLVKVGNNGGTITPIKTWQMTTADSNTYNANGGEMRWNDDVTISYDPDPSVYYAVTAVLPDNLGVQNGDVDNASVQSTVTYIDTTGMDMTSHQSGLRVAGVRNYTQAGALSDHKVLKYINEDGSSSGKLMAPYHFLSKRHMAFADEIDSDPANPLVQEGWLDIWMLSSESAVPYSDAAGGNPVGYSRVEEVEVSPNGATNGKHIYYYNNQESNTMLYVPDDPNLLNGKVSKEDLLDAGGDSLLETTYRYTNLSGHPGFDGVKVFSNYFGNKNCNGVPPVGGVAVDSMPPYGVIYDINYYPINSAWYAVQEKDTRQYAQGNYLTTTETYTYNSLGQVVQQQSANSKQQTTTTLSAYPVDSVAAAGSVVQAIKDQGLYSYLLRQRILLNGQEVTRVDINYADPGQVVQSAINKSFNGGADYADVTFDSYGPYKNILQFTQKGMTTAIIWSADNTYPIAEVTNAVLPAVAYTSFETDGPGNWVIPDATRDTLYSLTGRQSYDLTSGKTISATVSAPGKSYIVSYWSRNGAATVTGNGTAAPVKVTGLTKNGWTYYEHLLPAGVSGVGVTGSGLTIDELRLYPSDAQMVSYTYRPLMGILTSCNAANLISYYEYDGLGRLILTRDQDGNILKTYEYHYKQ